MAWLQLGLLAAALAIASIVDVRHRIIPNGCVAAALLVRLAYMAYCWAQGEMNGSDIAYYALSTAAVGCFLTLFTIAFDRITKTEGLGGGDIKLYSVAALYTGWETGACIVAASCLLGAVWAAFAQVKRRPASEGADMDGGLLDRTVPFAPFISIALLAALVLGG